MARKRKKKTIRILLILVTIIYGLYLSEMDSTLSSDKTQDVFHESSNNLKVHFLDVGQADSILIESNNEYMLIDAGNNEDGNGLVKYFNQMNITNFKYVVGTHPHEDHIGGLDDVINNFKIETIFMPDVITTTKTFVDVLDAIESNKMTYRVPKIREEIKLGDASLKVIYTGNDERDLNNTSIVLRFDYRDVCFLFTGDAEKKVENIILNSELDIECDVLKIGHHGSKYSTTDKFLNKVNPKYAIISAGTDNKYNHPEDVVINKLNKKNIEIHRTDLEGTIIATSDGKTVSFNNIKTNING